MVGVVYKRDLFVRRQGGIQGDDLGVESLELEEVVKGSALELQLLLLAELDVENVEGSDSSVDAYRRQIRGQIGAGITGGDNLSGGKQSTGSPSIR